MKVVSEKCYEIDCDCLECSSCGLICTLLAGNCPLELLQKKHDQEEEPGGIKKILTGC